jgi:SAM-dependent methyltransferase
MKKINFKNYEDYKNAQETTNKKKIDRIGISDIEIDDIVKYINTNIKNISFGLCHGVRNGYEIKQFSKKLNCSVIGTDISETANQFENVIQFDFHNQRDDWIGKFDFIYSNALDHSFDPNLALRNWLDCLNDEGLCFIGWSVLDSILDEKTRADCFAASKEEYEQLIKSEGILVDILHHEVYDKPIKTIDMSGGNRITFVVSKKEKIR